MDESGFAVGATQSPRALVNIRNAIGRKQTGSRQEWIIAIDCVSTSEIAVTLLLLFKPRHPKTGWTSDSMVTNC